MSWSSKTLSDSFSGVIAETNKKLDALKGEIAALAAQKTRLSDSIGEADDALKLVDSVTEDAASSGIYHLTLPPEQGSWSSRILNTAGAPPRNPGDYSAVIVNLAVASDINKAQEAKDAITSATTKVVGEIKAFIKVPSLSALKPPASVPSIPAAIPVPDNQWTSVTLGDIFPSLGAEMSGSITAALQKKEQAESSLADLDTALTDVQAEIDDLQDFIDSLAGNGVYNFIAEPEAVISGDWYARMTKPQTDPDTLDSVLPGTDPTLYVSGTVTVIIAASLAELASKFTTFKLKSG